MIKTKYFKRVIIFAIVIGLLIGISTIAQNYQTKRTRELAAETIVARALIDVKRCNADDLFHLTQSNSLLWRVKASKRRMYGHKMLNALKHSWGLENIPDETIRHSVKAIPNAPRSIVASIIRFSQGTDCSADYSTWAQDQPTVVEYVIHGRRMISVVWLENGMWKIDGTPLAFKASILKYQTVSEAIEHNDADASVEAPFKN